VTRKVAIIAVLAIAAYAQPKRDAVEPKVEFVCPMDPDVRSTEPGVCRRCGMRLVAGLPDPIEYGIELNASPAAVRPGVPVDLSFRVRDPKTKQVVMRFEVVHEKLFHLFVVSRDLSYFAHEHPEIQADGSFRLRTKLPSSGEYRLLCDMYPSGGTPQMIPTTVIVPGPSHPASLAPDLSPKQDRNLRVSLRTEPNQPVAGQKTLLFFDVEPRGGLEPYLGAWGHLLVASADLIDMVHTHPAFDDAAKAIQFNVIFPRPGIHRLWVQFQSGGVVNTAAFNVEVSELR